MLPGSQIRQILLLLLIAALLALIFWNLRLFVPSLLGAYTLFVLLRRPVAYLSETRKWNPKLAVSALMLLSFVVIFIPINALLTLLSGKLVDRFQDSESILQPIENLVLGVENRVGIHLLTPDRMQDLSSWGIHELSSVLNATMLGLLQLLIAYFILWFMLTDGKKMEASFFKWLPLKDENILFVRKELNTLVFSNAIGIPLMGVVQGMAGLLGYWLAGVEDIWFWVFMTFIAGMMPFLGVALAFFPLALILFSKGMTGQAVFILLYGMFVIGTVDNFARMWLLKKIGHTHPLVTLFGVILGLQLFGFIGFIFGPIMISMFFLLVRIYHKEFRA